MDNKLKIIKNILLGVIFYLALFQNALEGINGKFGNIDELLCVGLVLIALVKLVINRNVKIEHKSIYILISIIFMLMLGFAGNFVYGYQDIKYAMKDAILMFKGLMVYISIPIVFDRFEINDYSKSLNLQLRIIAVLTFIITVANLFLKILPTNEVRFGFATQQFIFSHPTYLASFGVMVIALLSVFSKQYKNNWIYILLMSVAICLTGRTKVVVFLAVYAYIYFLVIMRSRKIGVKDIGILSVLGSVFAAREVIVYLTHIYWARSAITIGSLRVASEHFPLGTGFGTYASWISGEHYSALYYKYGMEVVPGLRPDFYEFIADTFWPMILGQFGIIGLAIFIYIIFNIYKKITENVDIYKYFGQITLLAYMLVLSLAEASFSGPIAVIYFGIIAILSQQKIDRSK